jgi:hypothetical protein
MLRGGRMTVQWRNSRSQGALEKVSSFQMVGSFGPYRGPELPNREGDSILQGPLGLLNLQPILPSQPEYPARAFLFFLTHGLGSHGI